MSESTHAHTAAPVVAPPPPDVASEDLVRRIRAIVAECGLPRAMRILATSRTALAGVLSGARVRPSTLAMLRERVSQYEATEGAGA